MRARARVFILYRVTCGAFTNVVLLPSLGSFPAAAAAAPPRVKGDIPPQPELKQHPFKHQYCVGNNAPSFLDGPVLSGMPSSCNVVDLTPDVREHVAIFRA